MKTIEEMTNIEKAKLLADLFKPSLPELVQCLEAGCNAYLNNESATGPMWGHGIITAEFWFDQVRELKDHLMKYKSDMKKSVHVFAEHGFYGYRSLVSVQILLDYATVNIATSKLAAAIQLLFG
ncbi:hypothetical protein [Sphingobacterium sp. BIGb0116]|uniref:hypothetical protein n=1 Tax=Sphingobacterium sp. BIGb0116 TaxID=2940619 RepID=UPI00216A2F43|nr:hypothetical protein [Sphingobacterium sp. BIGb0116]MCS4165154.1 hypothetical protein [Sphingobacterium sp. BIGb0116]